MHFVLVYSPDIVDLGGSDLFRLGLGDRGYVDSAARLHKPQFILSMNVKRLPIKEENLRDISLELDSIRSSISSGTGISTLDKIDGRG